MERNHKAYRKILAQYEDMTQDLFLDIRRGVITSFDEFEAKYTDLSRRFSEAIEPTGYHEQLNPTIFELIEKAKRTGDSLEEFAQLFLGALTFIEFPDEQLNALMEPQQSEDDDPFWSSVLPKDPEDE